MEEKKTKVVMVLAHPDDEIIFGWPIFQDDDYEKEIIMCSSDFNNNAKFSGHIKSIKYYPRRLSNTQLQELTT